MTNDTLDFTRLLDRFASHQGQHVEALLLLNPDHAPVAVFSGRLGPVQMGTDITDPAHPVATVNIPIGDAVISLRPDLIAEAGPPRVGGPDRDLWAELAAYELHVIYNDVFFSFQFATPPGQAGGNARR